MCVPHIGNPLAALGGVRARKGHDALPRGNKLVDYGSYGCLIRHVHANNVVWSFCSLQEPLPLILCRHLRRRKILVGNRHALIQVLTLRVLYARRHGVPPGVHGLVGKIEVVMVLLRGISVELVLEVHHRPHALFGRCVLWNVRGLCVRKRSIVMLEKDKQDNGCCQANEDARCHAVPQQMFSASSTVHESLPSLSIVR